MKRFEVVSENLKIATLKTATKREAELYVRKHLKLVGIEHMNQKWSETESGNLMFRIPEINLVLEFIKLKQGEELIICS